VYEFLYHLIEHYGYWVVGFGSIIEGETIVAIGGYFAREQALDLKTVMAIAFIGSFAGDQALFQLGKRLGPEFLARRPRLNVKAEKVFGLLSRYQTLFILGFRFVYGMRTISPLAIGASGLSTTRFFLLNGCAAAVWAVLVSLLGFFFGEALDLVLGRVQHVQMGVLALIVLSIAIWLVVRWLLARRRIIP
jgi:membrane protein DedA with SNARE-associated domain